MDTSYHLRNAQERGNTHTYTTIKQHEQMLLRGFAADEVLYTQQCKLRGIGSCYRLFQNDDGDGTVGGR